MCTVPKARVEKLWFLPPHNERYINFRRVFGCILTVTSTFLYTLTLLDACISSSLFSKAFVCKGKITQECTR